MDAADMVNCCRAGSKEDCKRPPCPCNMSAYSPDELRQLKQKHINNFKLSEKYKL